MASIFPYISRNPAIWDDPNLGFMQQVDKIMADTGNVNKMMDIDKVITSILDCNFSTESEAYKHCVKYKRKLIINDLI